MPADRTINYIEFAASDLDAVKAFYSKAFDWSFTDYGPDYAAFNDGQMDGGFHRAPLSSSAAAGAALVVLYAEDLEATLDTVVACGGRVVKPIFAFPGGRRFHFADPAGNELAVWSDRGG
ncbi:VOC family protein [Marilutibacter chinensis]|uniref:VOC family protein n=1 Tax=Marilutibacter chinensis TaxID=2912247 RepID=A0ABS9HU09_9GAMM|nr:VOC family protein [Lysobacter chinensis]MCF7222173.1 VOC family protein [Lysobacter chinensis]